MGLLVLFMISVYRYDLFYEDKHLCNRNCGKTLDYSLDGPGLIPGLRGVEIFLHSFMPRLVLGSTQPPIKYIPGAFTKGKGGRA